MKAVIKVFKYLVVFLAGAITPIILFFKFLKKFPDAIDTWKEWVIKTLADLFCIRVHVVHRTVYQGYRPGYSKSSVRYTSTYRMTLTPDDLIFGSEWEADNVLNMMKDRINTFGVCTITDFYGISDQPVERTYLNDIYGWKDLSNAYVEPDYDGRICKLVLPKAEYIR